MRRHSVLIGSLAMVFVSTNGCKSRGWNSDVGSAGLQSVGTGPSETDNALIELELVDCSQSTDAICGSAAGDGVALMNPSMSDLKSAYAKRGIKTDFNPYELGGGRTTGNIAYALSGESTTEKSGQIAASAQGAKLDEVAGAWRGFAQTAAPLHRTPSVAAAVEVLVRGVIGNEIIDNPGLFNPVRFVSTLEQASSVFDQLDAGTITEQAAREQVAAIVQSGGFGHPVFDRLARGAISGNDSNGLKLDTGFGASFVRNFARLRAVSRWYDKNLVAANQERKAELIVALKDLVPHVKKLEEILLRHKITEEARLVLLDTLRIVAGQDGFINFGDLPRLLPIVPNLVGQVADKKIDQGLADGIADLRATRPFVYRRWVKRPNGLIGRVVNKEINKSLNDAYAQKFRAINDASAQVQGVFNDTMRRVGVDRHFLLSDSPKRYFDPAAPLELAQIDRLVRALTGRSVLSVAEEAASGGKVGVAHVEALARELESPMNTIFQRVELPDGIFVEEAIQLAEKQMGVESSDLTLPDNLQFVLANNGKIRVGRRRAPCSCEYMEKVSRCVFKFNPHAKPQAATDKQFYQPLNGNVASRDGKSACDDRQQCAVQFGRRDFQYFMPYACGGYFWTKPGEVLYTVK